jgi:2-amino-4-hydroxy-6-hydroxymethyldihydropteridine diphosphokinase
LPNAPFESHVLVALGSNRGPSTAIVRAAMARLRAFAAADFRQSSLWRTSPVDCPPDSADFVNAVVAFVPAAGVTPESLLAALKALEQRFGRDLGTPRNAPRELDLDLILFGREQRASDAFRLPHPRGHLRRFVLAPAAEVAATRVWPGLERTIEELLAALPPGESAVRIE